MRGLSLTLTLTLTPPFASPGAAPAAAAARQPVAARPRHHDSAGAAAHAATPAALDLDPDLELTARARGGDAAAFRELVERHQGRAYAVALRIVRSQADAEEVAQDAFVRAWRALAEFRGESRFGTWLHRIVVRRALDRAEVLGRRRARERALDAAPESAAPAGGPDPEVARRARRLDSLMGELSDTRRAVVALYYYEDQSIERVAQAMELPENTVKTHLSRARAALRAAWLRAGGDA